MIQRELYNRNPWIKQAGYPQSVSIHRIRQAVANLIETYVSHMPHHLKGNRSSDKHGLCTMRPMSRVFRHLTFKEYFTVKAYSVTISGSFKAFLAIVCLGIQPSYPSQNVVLSKALLFANSAPNSSRKKARATLLSQAAACGYEAAVRLLLAEGVDPDRCGYNARKIAEGVAEPITAHKTLEVTPKIMTAGRRCCWPRDTGTRQW